MANKRKLAGQIRRNWEGKVTTVLLGAVLLFVVVYVPTSILDALGGRLADWAKLLVKVGASVPLTFLASWLVFSQDHLATGSSRASRFFRDQYPSTYAARRYQLTQGEADRLWFDYFNTWEAAEHPLHHDYESTFQRSYSLRLIFYLKRVLVLFVLFALVATVLSIVLRSEDASPMLAVRAIVGAVALMMWIWLQVSNRFRKRDDSEDYEATGAYFKYMEISGIIRSRFDADVLAKRATARNS